jgi:ribosomal protein L16/L10AE
MPPSSVRKFRDNSEIRKRSLSRKPVRNGDALAAYKKKFIQNGLKVQNELMINHEAIEAAEAEYLAEFRRKRQAMK